jgi:hypothetical protein
MIDEIPAFLFYLNQRQMQTKCESRMWFNPSLLITEALKRIQASSKSSVEKEIRERLKNMFIDFEENIIYMTIGDLRKEFFNNKYDERYIAAILRDNIGADMYWEPAEDPAKKSYKFKRYSFPKYNLIWTDGGKRQEIERTDIRGNGRPFVFLRPDFVPAEDEEGLEHNADMQLLANPVPEWYWKEGMLK